MAEPLCPYFGECGGCSSQHIDYALQVENKRKAVADATGFPDISVFTAEPYAYRNRMDMIFHASGLGFRQKGKWQSVVDITNCAISNAKLNGLLAELRQHFPKPDYFDAVRKTGTLRYAVIRTPGQDSSVSFVLNAESPRIADAVDTIKEFAAKSSSNNIIITYVSSDTDMSVSDDFFAVKGEGMLKESLLGKEFSYSVQGFFQNNHALAGKMQQYCHELLKAYATKDAHLLDLYGGVGTFGIINAGLFKAVTIVESHPQSIEAAALNIRGSNILNAKALLLDAKQLQRVSLPAQLFVILDPPRSGMHQKTIEQLNRLKPKAMLYVSCNVQQLKKDIAKFRSYAVKSAALFDFFPQTPHSEAVVELVPR